METIYRNKFTGREFVVERIVNDHMISLRSTDGKRHAAVDKGGFRLLYDRLPASPSVEIVARNFG